MLRYSICLRQQQGYCCVEYSVCSDTDQSNFSFDQQDTDSPGVAKVGTDCITAVIAGTYSSGDYITIEGMKNRHTRFFRIT